MTWGPRNSLVAAAAVVVGAGLAYFAWTAINGPIGVPLTSATPNAGQAATQFGAVGFYLKVDGVKRNGDQVEVSLTFVNKSAQQQRANPQDFSLEGRSTVRPTFGSGCPDWGRVDLYPPGGDSNAPLRDPNGTRAGATWGPSLLCFSSAGSGALTLIWEPDVAFGPLSEPIRIPLR